MEKIKICDVVLNSVWYDPRVVKQIEEYYKNEFDISVVGIEDNRYNENEIDKLKGVVKIIKLKEIYKKYRNKFFAICKHIYIYRMVMKQIVECKPDVIHANDLNALLPAYFAAKKIKSKLIYDTHEIFVEYFSKKTEYLKRKFWSIVERKIISQVDAVVCVSNAAASYMLKKYSNIKKILVVTNCSKYQEIIEHNVSKSDKFEVLNQGMFYEGRGYDLMLEAARLDNNDNIRYVLRGFGRLENSLKQFVIDNKLENVHFPKPVKTSELILCAKTASVGVAITIPINLNFKLSVSNKIFEYLAAGLPVIMSDIPEHRYLNEKYNFGIILEENTPMALKNAVELLYRNKELYDMYSKNAISLSRDLNWETEFQKIINLEKNLIETL